MFGFHFFMFIIYMIMTHMAQVMLSIVASSCLPRHCPSASLRLACAVGSLVSPLFQPWPIVSIAGFATTFPCQGKPLHFDAPPVLFILWHSIGVIASSTCTNEEHVPNPNFTLPSFESYVRYYCTTNSAFLNYGFETCIFQTI